MQAAAEELGFRTDPIARALRGGATRSVGMVVGSLADLYLQELVAGVQRHLRAGGRQLLIADADGDPALEVELALELADRRVDALIVSPIGPFATGWARSRSACRPSASASACPARQPPGRCSSTTSAPCARCSSTSRSAGTGASACSPGRSSARRRGAPSRRCSSGRSASGSRRSCTPASTASTARSRSRAISSRRRTGPTAIFALSDSVALGVYAACRELGLRIPEDVAVVGFDDQPVSRLLDPPLTSVRWHTDRIAEIAVRLAVGASEEAALARTAIVPPALHARGSTG